MEKIEIEITQKETAKLFTEAPMGHVITMFLGGCLETVKGSWEYKTLMEMREIN